MAAKGFLRFFGKTTELKRESALLVAELLLLGLDEELGDGLCEGEGEGEEEPLDFEDALGLLENTEDDIDGLLVVFLLDDLLEEKSEELPAKPEEKERSRVQKTRNTHDNRKSVNRSSVNPIALKREREARAAEEKRKEDAIKEKEKRTEYYLNRVRINAPTKAARMYAEPVEEFAATSKREEPKTLLGRFFRWLTTA